MTDENNQIKFFLYENWARTKTGQHTVRNVCAPQHVGVDGGVCTQYNWNFAFSSAVNEEKLRSRHMHRWLWFELRSHRTILLND